MDKMECPVSLLIFSPDHRGNRDKQIRFQDSQSGFDSKYGWLERDGGILKFAFSALGLGQVGDI